MFFLSRAVCMPVPKLQLCLLSHSRSDRVDRAKRHQRIDRVLERITRGVAAEPQVHLGQRALSPIRPKH